MLEEYKNVNFEIHSDKNIRLAKESQMVLSKLPDLVNNLKANKLTENYFISNKFSEILKKYKF